MLKKFLSGAFVFAGSALLFSFVRQIIVLPALSHLDVEVFTTISYAIFSIEAIAYGFTGAIPDFYTKNIKNNETDVFLFFYLKKISYVSLLCFPIFLILGFGLFTSLISTVYILFFSFNSLYIKLYFNKLIFKENYIYVIFRVVPYLLFYLILKQGFFDYSLSDEMFVSLLLFFESLYYLKIRKCLQKVSGVACDKLGGHSIKAEIIVFILGYLLLGVIQRADLIVLKNIDINFYVDYAKLIIIISFFSNPLVLFICNPLLSFISRNKLSLDSPELRKIIFLTVFVTILSSLIGSGLYPFIYRFIFHEESSLSLIVCGFLIFSMILYNLLRTLSIRFLSNRTLFFLNLNVLMVCFPFIYFMSPLCAVLSFYVIRILIPMMTIIICGRLKK